MHAEFVAVEPGDDIVTEIAGADLAGEPISEEAYVALVAPPVLRRRPRTGPRSPRQGGWQRRS